MKLLMYCVIFLASCLSCKKSSESSVRYFRVSAINTPADWRDSAFIIAADDARLLAQIEEQLSLPPAQRKLVNGTLAKESGGFNKNASLTFNWHFPVNAFEFGDVTAEIYDGRPYSDVHTNINYWLRLGRFGPWGMRITEEITP